VPFLLLFFDFPNIEITDYHMRQALNNAGKILEFTKSKLQELGFVPETEPPQN